MLALVLTFSLSGFATKATTASKAAKPTTLTIISEMKDSWVRNFNSFINNALQATQGFVYEPLIVFDTYNNNKEIPWLAQKVVSLADNKTIMIYVRKGVKWSDGQDLTANDVAFTFNYTKNHEAIDRNGDWDMGTGKDLVPGRFASVTVVDKYTVKMVLKVANRFARNSIFYQRYIVPEHIYSKITNPESYVLKDAVGTGPFTTVKSVTPEMMVMDRNPLYWQAAKLKVDEMRWPQVNSNDAALQLLQTGAVDWAHIMIPDIQKNYVQGDPNKKYWYGKNDGIRLAFNFQDDNKDTLKAFNDVNFRRAVSLCVDRKGIIDSAAYGYLSKDCPPATGLPPALLGYEDKSAQAEMAKYTKFDVDAAKKILADAGYKDVNKDGFLENPDGSTLKFDITSPAGWSDWNQGASIVAQGLKKAGINATAKAIDLAMYTDSWKNNNHDIMYGGWGLSADIYRFYYDTIGDQSRIKTVSWWSTNMTNLANDQMTALVASLPNAKTDADVKKITSQVEQYFAKNMINIPIAYNGNWVVYNTSRFTGWATAANPFVNPANVQHDTKLVQLLALKPVTK